MCIRILYIYMYVYIYIYIYWYSDTVCDIHFCWIPALSMSQHWQEVLLWKQRSANISNILRTLSNSHLHMRFENSHHMSSLNLRQIRLTSWPLYTAGHWDHALPDWIPHLTTVQSTCDFVAPPKKTKFSHFERFELNTQHKKTNRRLQERTYCT